MTSDLSSLNNMCHCALDVTLAGPQSETSFALGKTHHHHLLHVGLASFERVQSTFGLKKNLKTKSLQNIEKMIIKLPGRTQTVQLIIFS